MITLTTNRICYFTSMLRLFADMGQFAPHHSWGYSHSTAYSTWPGGGGCTNFTPPALTTGFTGTVAASELHTSLSAGHQHDLFATCTVNAQTTAAGKYLQILYYYYHNVMLTDEPFLKTRITSPCRSS